MSVTIGSIRGRGRRVLLVLAMAVGILSLSVFAAARFVEYRLPPCSNSAHISEFEGEYVAYGTFRGGGATYRFEISPERILWWPGVPFDGDASEIGRGRKAVLREHSPRLKPRGFPATVPLGDPVDNGSRLRIR